MNTIHISEKASKMAGECADAICKVIQTLLAKHEIRYNPSESRETIKGWIVKCQQEALKTSGND